MTDDFVRHRLYGRRKGKALRSRQAGLVETLLPGLRVDLSNPGLPDTAPGRLEIGFGGGEHLAHRAALDPDVRFLGAESFINGTAKLLALIADRSLTNIRIHDGDARALLEALPAASLDTVYLLYPDPWPKHRHLRRRFVNQDNLASIQRVLIPGGHFLFASDIASYVAWTLLETHRHGGLAWTATSAADWRQPPPGWIETRYEAKARREGRTPCYLSFIRR